MKRTPKVRDAEVSRQRVWAAAAEAFATAGFDGAKVDEIAQAAGINKAMVYYHFADKLTLYREILRDMFSAVARATTEVRATGGEPEDQLRGYVAAMVQAAEARPHFPSIWLREVAESGRNLDPSVFVEMRAVLTNLGAILQDGVRTKRWRVVDPFLVQAGIAAPIMLVLATRGLRQQAGVGSPATNELPLLVDHFTTMTLAMLATPRKSAR